VNPAGHPAKDRGLYFDGTSDGFIPITDLALSHTFSIHFWALLKANNKAMTLLSIDRNDFTEGTDTKTSLDLGVTAGNLLDGRMAKFVDPTAVSAVAGGSTLNTGSWNYIIYSFATTDGKDTDAKVYLANTKDGEATLSNTFYYDATKNPAFIGVARGATNTADDNAYTTHWHGFVAEIVIY
jgi:hypothetical protein